ncbi:hypothetical protein BDW74DRAFT_146819 [Aspergillus multicolor]|uniref:uncharacterized protein n=1 Tax=Aspergillus multicolor TaxID=41759 RepID=UPI003CCD069F
MITCSQEAKITHYHIIAIYISVLLHHQFGDGWSASHPEHISQAFSQLSQHHRDIVQTALLPSWHDECHCFCSLMGCTPFIMAFWAWSDKHRYAAQMYHEKYFRPNMVTIMQALVSELLPRLDSAREVIRVFTFADLSLTHTCCHVKRKYHYEITPFDREDALEIHDEERLLLEDFEALLEKLYAEYDLLGLPLWDFIERHWCKRIWDHLERVGETVSADKLCVLFSRKVGEV